MGRFVKSVFSLNSVSITVAVTLLVLFLCVGGIPILELVELKTYDLRFISRGAVPPSPSVVIGAIDEKSLEKESHWPWPRSRIGELITVLSRSGAKVIGLDIGFLEPDENSTLKLVNRLDRDLEKQGVHNEELRRLLGRARREADNDRALAEAILHADAAVVLGYFFHMRVQDLNFEMSPQQIEDQLDRIGPSQYPLVKFRHSGMSGAPFLRAYAPQANLDILALAADAAGYFNMTPDADGVVRWMPLIIQCGENAFPPLSVQCLWHSLDRPMMLVDVAPHGVEGIRMGERFIPTDEHGMMLINYLGPGGTFPYYSVTDILDGRHPTEAFKDRIVLIGATATGIYDVRNTPFGPIFPGVEVHATLIDNILNQRFLSKPKWAGVYDLLAIVMMNGLMGLVLPRLSPLRALASAVFLFGAHLLTAGYLFSHNGVWLNVTYPLTGLVLTYVSLTAFYYFTEQREKKRIRGTFSHYVPEPVIEEMLLHPEKLKLGGEERMATVLFSDLMGFSRYSERYTPHEMITFLSEYFEEMTVRVFRYGGMLKEYLGDELMAVFGAPLPHEDHARQACLAALEMRRRLVELQRVWADAGRPALDARIGVNSGPMLVGNTGSSFRFSYGVLGDAVNLASRLEGLSGIYGTRVLIGENTVALVNDAFVFRHIDVVGVKGRDRPVRIYELLGEAGVKLPDSQAACMERYGKGLDAYFRQHWREAIRFFEEALLHLPEDGPSRLMIERCVSYLDDPPVPGWDGVFRFDKKR